MQYLQTIVRRRFAFLLLARRLLYTAALRQRFEGRKRVLYA